MALEGRRLAEGLDAVSARPAKPVTPPVAEYLRELERKGWISVSEREDGLKQVALTSEGFLAMHLGRWLP